MLQLPIWQYIFWYTIKLFAPPFSEQHCLNFAEKTDVRRTFTRHHDFKGYPETYIWAEMISSDVPSESDVAPTTFAVKVDKSLRRHLDIHKTSAAVHKQPAEDILKYYIFDIVGLIL